MKIVLACNAGMSTSMMKMRLADEAKKRGIEAEVIAVPVSEIDEYIDGISVLLLGPQVRFMEKEIKEKYTNFPVIVMNMADYGSMNAKKVFDESMEAMENFNK